MYVVFKIAASKVLNIIYHLVTVQTFIIQDIFLVLLLRILVSVELVAVEPFILIPWIMESVKVFKYFLLG